MSCEWEMLMRRDEMGSRAEVMSMLGSKFPKPPFELSYPVFDGKTVLILATVLISKSSQGETNHSIFVGSPNKINHF